MSVSILACAIGIAIGFVAGLAAGVSRERVWRKS